MAKVYFGLGSNLGDRRANLAAAIEALGSHEVEIAARSPIYETEPIGATEEPVPDYLNCVVSADTRLSPETLVDITQAIERSLGRHRTYHWGPRPIDIDLLLYGDVSLESDRLSLPHPRMRERLFVLRPLADLEPDFTLPTGERIVDLIARPEIASQRISLLHDS